MSKYTDKQLVIFETALELFRERGMYATPMSQLAEAAGVATGTIYHYFSSKDELIVEMFRHYRAQVVHIVKRALEAVGSHEERFMRMWMAVTEFYLAHPKLLVFFEQFTNSPYYGKVDFRADEDRPLSQFLDDAIRRGLVRCVDTQLLITLIASSCIAAAKAVKMNPDIQREGGHMQIAGMIWRGLSTSQKPLAI